MIAEDVRALPLPQKLHLMEVLWDDLRGHFDGLELSEIQKQLLDLRRKRVQEGKATLVDWDAARTKLGA